MESLLPPSLSRSRCLARRRARPLDGVPLPIHPQSFVCHSYLRIYGDAEDSEREKERERLRTRVVGWRMRRWFPSLVPLLLSVLLVRLS